MAVTPSPGAASTISPSTVTSEPGTSLPGTRVVVTPGAVVAPGLLAPGATVVAPGATVVAVVFVTKKSPVIVGLLHELIAGAGEAPGIWATAANAASTSFSVAARNPIARTFADQRTGSRRCSRTNSCP